jgi:hypothetical protein
MMPQISETINAMGLQLQGTVEGPDMMGWGRKTDAWRQ